jgi:hypothetical protein
MSTQPALPVLSRADRLPFHELSWERFEVFALDLMSRRSDFTVAHRYGGPGHDQQGIDILADHRDGSRWGLSNKRYKTYQVHHVLKHIEDTTYPADQYILLLSGIASPDVRKEVKNHPKWDVWDADDLSQQVRELASSAPEAARRLVDDHFGTRWRSEFLGLPSVGAFYAAPDYFRRWREEGRLFHHRHALVGRSEALRSLHEFVMAPGERVALLLGRGGIGKSRLLCAFADEFEERYARERLIRFLVDGVPLTQEALDELPLGPCIVVVDDAHRYEDLGFLLEWVQQHARSKLLLATRPQGEDVISACLTRGGYDTRQVRRLEPLRSLSPDDRRALARESLGEGNEAYAERLARATRDCPLATVMGGQLLREKSILPELLERDDEFQRVLLDRFRDELIGCVTDTVPVDLCQKLLRLYAAVAPVPTEEPQFYRRASEFLCVDEVELVRATGELEGCGLLLRRGRQLRISPDVLSDHILHEACLTTQGAPTGFAQEVFEAFLEFAPAAVLTNLAELDWRLSAVSGREPALLQDIWRFIEEDFFASPNSVRYRWISFLEPVAYFQPGRTLALLRRAVREPAADEDEDAGGLYRTTHRHVLQAIPSLLQRVAFSQRHLPVCLDLLWELARDDSRPTNPIPEHPLRIIADIAAYEPRKPVAIQRIVAGAVRRWLRCHPVEPGRPSPLQFLQPLLAKSGTFHEQDGPRLRICSFGIDSASVAEVRREAIAVLRNSLRSPDLVTILGAVSVLGGALHGPLPYLNMEFGEEQLAQWEPEQLEIISILDEFLKTGPHPLVQVHIVQELAQRVRYDRSEAVCRRAREASNSAEESYELNITRLLVPRLTDWDSLVEDDNESPTDRRNDALTRIRERVVPEFWSRNETAESALAELDARFSDVQIHERDADLRHLGFYLLASSPDRAEGIASAILANPDRPSAVCFGNCLEVMERDDPNLALRWLTVGLESGNDLIGRIVANHFRWRRVPSSPAPQEVELIGRLLNHQDEFIKCNAVGALRNLILRDARLRLDLARQVEVGSSDSLASELCAVLEPTSGLTEEAITDDDYRAVLSKLDAVNNLNHQVFEFLSRAAARLPNEVIGLILRRINRADFRSNPDYRPIPYGGLPGIFTSLEGTAAQAPLLRQVRDQALTDGSIRHMDLARLFQCLSNNFGATGLEVLREWIDSADATKVVAPARFLQEARPSFVFDNIEYVEHALEQAERLGSECYRKTGSAFYFSAVGGPKQGVAGEPYPQDIHRRDRARATLEGLVPGTPIYQLFDDVRRHAERDIENEYLEAEEDAE